MHNLWRSVGSPRNGVINQAQIDARTKYKKAIKDERINGEKARLINLVNSFLKKI